MEFVVGDGIVSLFKSELFSTLSVFLPSKVLVLEEKVWFFAKKQLHLLVRTPGVLQNEHEATLGYGHWNLLWPNWLQFQQLYDLNKC